MRRTKKEQKNICAFEFLERLLTWSNSTDRNEIQFYIRKIRFLLYFFIKKFEFFFEMKFFWNAVFALNLNFRARLFFRQVVSSSNFFFAMSCSIKFYHFFFLSFENAIWKITSFEFPFFRSIWKCDVIDQKRIFDDVATSYLTGEGQTRTRSVIRLEKWCWMNIIFTWWKVIQSENSSSFKKHIKIFISFVFFFRQIFFN